MKKQVTAALLCFMLAVIPAMAQDTRNETVKFSRGSSGTTIEDSITGHEAVKYSVGVSAGQTMSVQLDTDNSSNYFNITAPGASEALYKSSIDGNGTSLVIPSSGNYIIDVYLMRNAARRNETANYTLTLYVENAAATAPRSPQAPQPASSTAGVSTTDMPRFCQGEASAKFSVRPQDLTTNMAFKSGNNYVVQGNFDVGGSSTFFNCYFGLDGSFLSVN